MSAISILLGRKKKPTMIPWTPPVTPVAPVTPTPPVPASFGWTLGPVINGQNYSVGTVCDPATGSFTWPKAEKGKDRWQTPGPHYLTRPTVGLPGSVIRAHFEISGDGQFFGSVGGQSETAYICLFFRALGDNWQGIDGFRWWSEAQFPITPGVHTVVEVPLEQGSWVSVNTKGTPEQFALAVASAVEVGLTFGNDEGRGHGVSSPTGWSSFTLHSFVVVSS